MELWEVRWMANHTTIDQTKGSKGDTETETETERGGKKSPNAIQSIHVSIIRVSLMTYEVFPLFLVDIKLYDVSLLKCVYKKKFSLSLSLSLILWVKEVEGRIRQGIWSLAFGFGGGSISDGPLLWLCELISSFLSFSPFLSFFLSYSFCHTHFPLLLFHCAHYCCIKWL